MPSPLPAPPPTRFVPAAQEVLSRDGATVVLQRQRNLCRWAVHVSLPDSAEQLLVGPLEGQDANPSNTVLAAQIQDAVACLGAAALPVYADTWSTKALLEGRTGLRLTGLSPRPAALAAARQGIDRAEGRLVDRLVLTCDASRRDLKGPGVAGCGWVLSYRNGVPPLLGSHTRDRVATIRHGELAAIALGVADTLRHHPALAQGRGFLTVQSDSMRALRLIQRIEAGEDTSGESAPAVAEARGVVEALRGVRHRFEWVRGHDGNPVQELSDRLAVLARRNREAGVDRATSARMLAAIREDAPALLAA